RRVREVLSALRRREIDPERTEQFEKLIEPFNGQPFSPLEGLRARSILLAHDYLGSHGFVIEGFGAKLGYATDLGRVSRALLEQFCDLDLLALESNYDPQMQEQSPRPWTLKRRITGGAGHLSNAQALTAIRAILDRCEKRGSRMPAHIV